MSANNGPTINTLASLNERLGNNQNYVSDVEQQQYRRENDRPAFDARNSPEIIFMTGVVARSNHHGNPEHIALQFFSPRKGDFQVTVVGALGQLTRSQRSLIRAALSQADEMESRGEM